MEEEDSTNLNSEIRCAAFKPWEILDIAGKHGVANHFGKVNVDIDRIKSVYCPTSMMALDFILKQYLLLFQMAILYTEFWEIIFQDYLK